jgi:hypothetical protein
MVAFWAWLKKYWELLAAGLLVVLGFCLGLSLRKRPTVQGANPVKEKAEQKAQADTSKAEQKATEQKAEALEKHDADVAVVVDQVQQKTEEVRSDPEKTNEYLQGVSRSIRGEDP